MNEQTTRLLQVKILLNHGELSEALSLIQSVDISTIQQFDDEYLSYYYHFYAECLHRSGQYKKALTKVRIALRYSRAWGNKSVSGEQKHLSGRILQQMGRLDEAAGAYRESYALLKRLDDYEGMTGPLDSLASLHHLRGDNKKASEVLQTEINHCHEHGLERKLTVARFNLARVRLHMGRFSEALHILENLEKELPGRNFMARIDNLKGIIYAYQFKAPGAKYHLNRALAHYRVIESRRDEVICLEYLGMADFLAGKYDSALRCYSEILSFPEITASARAQTLRLQTDVLIELGRIEEAGKTAEQAEEAIKKVSERVESGALFRSLGKIQSARGRHGRARGWLRASVNLLSQLDARHELAITYLTIGTSSSFDLKTQISYLKKALDLFTEMKAAKSGDVIKLLYRLTSPRFFQPGDPGILYRIAACILEGLIKPKH